MGQIGQVSRKITDRRRSNGLKRDTMGNGWNTPNSLDRSRTEPHLDALLLAKDALNELLQSCSFSFHSPFG